MTPPVTVGNAPPCGPKRLWLPLAWTVLIACVCAVGFMAIAGDAAAAERQIGAAKLVVHNVTGALGSEAPPVVLRAGIDVFQNEIIKTDQNSAARLVFGDQSDLSIGASSEVVLDKFVFDPDPSKSTITISVISGVTRFATGTLPKSAYTIRTPTATIGVRGTVLTITVGPEDKIEHCREGRRDRRREDRKTDKCTQVDTESGTAVVSSGGETVLVNAGESTTAAQGSPPSTPSASPPASAAVAEMSSQLQQAALQSAQNSAGGGGLLNQPTVLPSTGNCVSPSGPGGGC